MYCICIRKCNKNGEFSTFHFWRNLARDPVLVQGHEPNFTKNEYRVTSQISPKIKSRKFSIFITFPDTYTCSYAV